MVDQLSVSGHLTFDDFSCVVDVALRWSEVPPQRRRRKGPAFACFARSSCGRLSRFRAPGFGFPSNVLKINSIFFELSRSKYSYESFMV